MEKQKLDIPTTDSTLEEQYKVPGLENGLAIIEYLSEQNMGATLTEIRCALSISQTSSYRILNTLSRTGYVVYDDDKKLYFLSRKLLSIGFKTVREHDLLENVLPSLRQLRDEVKESVFFGVLGEKEGIVIEQAQGLYPFKFVVSPGSPFSLLTSAGGKAMLAYSSLQKQNYYISKIDFLPCTPNTISTEEAYRKELEQVAKNGYALDQEEALRGVVCIGAPIFGYEGHAIGAIWVSGPSDRINKQTMPQIINALTKTTDCISKAMGYNKLILN